MHFSISREADGIRARVEEKQGVVPLFKLRRRNGAANLASEFAWHRCCSDERAGTNPVTPHRTIPSNSTTTTGNAPIAGLKGLIA